MSNVIKIFENEEFGRVRTIIKDGEPWFVGKDVAEILEYRNTKKALSDHVDEEDKYQGDGVTIRDPMGRVQHPTIINESGLYSLILSSKMPRAKEFKRWVTLEISRQSAEQAAMSQTRICLSTIICPSSMNRTVIFSVCR